MSKYVRETKAGKAIAAWVVMKGARHVATVQAHYSDGGTCLVNIWNHGEAIERCAKAAKVEYPSAKAHDQFGFQMGRAGGYGYDKLTAALSGLMIDGHKLSDHCGGSKRPPKGRTVFPEGSKAPKGYSFANWRTAGQNGATESGWLSCHREAGLKYLEAMGYTVIFVI